MPMNIPGRYTKYKTPPTCTLKGEYDRVVSATGLKEQIKFSSIQPLTLCMVMQL